jgi:hypothetical protein
MIVALHRPSWAESPSSTAAGLYVDAERDIEFLPFELALLTNLTEVLRTLDGRFKAEEAQLPGEIAALAKEADALKPTPDDGAKRQRRQQELDELQARKKFSADIETFVARRNSLDVLIKTKACIAACSVGMITAHIRRKVLTTSLRDSLRDEIVALDLQHLPLTLADRGEVGKSKVHIGLEAQQKVGEQRHPERRREAGACAGRLPRRAEGGGGPAWDRRR